MKYIHWVLDYMAWFWFMEWLILDYITNRIIHGRLEVWNLSSHVHIRYLTCSLHSLVRYWCEHSKINSISSRAHVLFSLSFSLSLYIYIYIYIYKLYILMDCQHKKFSEQSCKLATNSIQITKFLVSKQLLNSLRRKASAWNISFPNLSQW